MTVIGVALAVNSTQSIRMAGAGSERIEAMSHAQGAQERLMSNKKGNYFITLPALPLDIIDNELRVVNRLTRMSDVGAEVNCMRNRFPNEASKIKCVPVEISSKAIFGRNDMGQLTIVVGIEQEYRAGN